MQQSEAIRINKQFIRGIGKYLMNLIDICTVYHDADPFFPSVSPTCKCPRNSIGGRSVSTQITVYLYIHS